MVQFNNNENVIEKNTKKLLAPGIISSSRELSYWDFRRDFPKHGIWLIRRKKYFTEFAVVKRRITELSFHTKKKIRKTILWLTNPLVDYHITIRHKIIILSRLQHNSTYFSHSNNNKSDLPIMTLKHTIVIRILFLILNFLLLEIHFNTF